MKAKGIELVFVILLYFCICCVNSSKYPHIGDCNWSGGSEHSEKLTFICYDHFHEDRFFNYDAAKKPCLNHKSGYFKDNIGQIQFQNCQFARIPYDIIEYYRFVWQLNISDVGLQFLNKNNFNEKYEQRLRTLLVSQNSLMEIESGLLDNVKHLNKVDFSFNKINRINPSAFVNSKELQFLDLSSNQLSILGAEIFFHLNNLSTLILRDNNIDLIDAMAFAGLKSLTKLDLSHNSILELNAQVFQESSLEFLNLSYNQISNIANFTSYTLSDLTELDISFNQIKSINELAAVNFGELAILNASHNFISNLSENVFGNFVKLIELNLSFNPIKLLNKEIFATLSNLQHLKLSNTHLTSIEHGTFFKPSHLQSIDLSANNFQKFDFNIFLPNLIELKELYLNGNQLTDVSGFRRALFPNLRTFGMQENSFNCSYLRFFFETIVWHELSIDVDRSFVLRSNNVGGIKCVDQQSELLSSTASENPFDNNKVSTSTMVPTFVTTLNLTWTSPSPFPPTSSPPSTSSSSRRILNETGENVTTATSSVYGNIELLLLILCIILVAILVSNVIINRDKICGKSKHWRPRSRSTTTMDSLPNVAYSTNLDSI